ncbi:MAG: hydrogenase [Acidobacteria bacterium]|nr:hydrogenase [Acidobacteriota bacterium]
MGPHDAKRRLIWHGIFLFMLGLLSGVVVPIVRNPRMGLSAHLGGVLDGMFLVLLGLMWPDLRMPPRLAIATFWVVLVAAYAGWAAQLVAAAFGTSWVMPIAGAGYVGTWWQETLVAFIAGSFSLAILIACGLLLYGLRRE